MDAVPSDPNTLSQPPRTGDEQFFVPDNNVCSRACTEINKLHAHLLRRRSKTRFQTVIVDRNVTVWKQLDRTISVRYVQQGMKFVFRNELISAD